MDPGPADDAATEPSRNGDAASLVDIDPGWYPGQIELETPMGISLPAAPVHPVGNVPTVLNKLQKWGDYQSMGTPVWPTRFVPMKTPLSRDLLENWTLPEAPKHSLTVADVIETHAAAGRRVGLFLDLSNHDCLYESDIPPDVQYQHIRLVAKELPPQDFVDAVVAAANTFWQAHPTEFIAVHCAYGFNRTGFVLCSYLIEECGLSVEDALESFAHSRPPGVKHEQFRRELHDRYNERCEQLRAGQLGGVVINAGSPPDDNSSFGCSPGSRSNMEQLLSGMARLTMRRLHSSNLCSSGTGMQAGGAGSSAGAMLRLDSAASLQAMQRSASEACFASHSDDAGGSGLGAPLMSPLFRTSGIDDYSPAADPRGRDGAALSGGEPCMLTPASDGTFGTRLSLGLSSPGGFMPSQLSPLPSMDMAAMASAADLAQAAGPLQRALLSAAGPIARAGLGLGIAAAGAESTQGGSHAVGTHLSGASSCLDGEQRPSSAAAGAAPEGAYTPAPVWGTPEAALGEKAAGAASVAGREAPLHGGGGAASGSGAGPGGGGGGGDPPMAAP